MLRFPVTTDPAYCNASLQARLQARFAHDDGRSSALVALHAPERVAAEREGEALGRLYRALHAAYDAGQIAGRAAR